MCGILGATQITNDTVAVAALRSFSYRGPDHTGYTTDHNVFLGNNRLSIVDLNSRSNQPIQRPLSRNRIILNGEIFNYKTLRDELVNAGCTFETSSDTEVILVGYEHEGVSFFRKLRGMYAFAIHDNAKEEIILARDHAGIKPLMYSVLGGTLVFASELKGVVPLLPKKPTISESAVSFLAGAGFIPSPDTLFTEIKKVPKGHYLRYSLKTATIETLVPINYSTTGANGDIELSIANAVIEHLESDVPVGVFFSGGIDSSLIAAILQQHKVPLKAFALAIERKEADIQYAKRIAEHLQIDVTWADFSVTEFDAVFVDVMSKIDEPTFDSSLLALYHIAKIAQRDVKVVLSGEGADELFYGYDRQLKLARFAKRTGYDRILCFLYNAAPSFRGRPRVFEWLFRSFGSSFAYYLFRTAPRSNATAWPAWLQRWQHTQQNFLTLDKDVYLENDLLRKIDSATSFASIEGRVPFLDVRLYEVPTDLITPVLQTNNAKVILKNYLGQFLPYELIDRPKSGMGLPMEKLFRESRYLKAELDQAVAYITRIPELQTLLIDPRLTYTLTHDYYYGFMLITLYHTLRNVAYESHVST